MQERIEFVARAVSLGIGATLVMDGWAWVLRRFGVPSLDMAMLGRWVGHLGQGRWRHERIAASPAVARERILGWITHYAIGVSFATLLLALFGLSWARQPSLGPALLVATGTVVAPLFVLQPALGLGIASRRTPRPLVSATKSLVTHLVYGGGLYLTARLTTQLTGGLG